MRYDDRGGVRYRGRRLLTPYSAGYAAAMARATRDLERLNSELQAELEKVRADLRELQTIVLLRQRADAELAGLYRERQIQRARGAQRDSAMPLQ